VKRFQEKSIVPKRQLTRIDQTVAKDLLGWRNINTFHMIFHTREIKNQLLVMAKQMEELTDELERKSKLLEQTTQKNVELSAKFDESQISRIELDRIHAGRLLDISAVSQPLILISQIQRSGGTLLARLFDGHPQCLSYGHELYIGHPNKSTWPRISLNDTRERWWEILKESAAIRHFNKGFYKFSPGSESEHEVLPFLLVPSLQERIFNEILAKSTIKTPRDVFDAYMTSYFNAWLDYKNISRGLKKEYVTAFVPRMHEENNNIEQFFSIYPDGFFITIVRDPLNWYASAARHMSTEYGDFRVAMQLWKASTKQSLKLSRQYRSRVILILFEDLVRNVDGIMRQVADLLEIDFLPSLTMPTFNGIPVKADSSFSVEKTGILPEVLDRSNFLEPNNLPEDEEAMNLYSEARARRSVT
jgi:hypothetical protein